MKSPVRWAGSKRLAVPRLKEFWGRGYRRYVEPFAGSASLFFDVCPPAAILGDLNWELVTAYRAIRRDAQLVLQCLRRLPTGKASYYRIRGVNPCVLSDAELAARFLYLNHFCFNGLYRTNLSGRFNVPYGPPKDGGRFNEASVLAAAEKLQSAQLLYADFGETLSRAEAGDFVFLDPPYAVDGRRVFREYLPGSFNSMDLARLGLALEALDAKGAAFVITYADSAESRKLFAPWKRSRLWVRRNIAGFAADRRSYYELLATNITI
ncbi:MAG: Dam family site-specific DNA-(adenine-N6)-methyltransferase [Candidatus Sulfotelmatobacter sp.]